MPHDIQLAIGALVAAVTQTLDSLSAEVRASREVTEALAAEVAALRRGAPTKDRPPSAAPFLTRAQAAELRHVSIDTIDRWIRSGALRTQRIGRLIRIDPGSMAILSDVEIARLAREARRAR